MASTTGRKVIIPLTNKSGGSVAAGDVVVIDTTTDESFTTTTSAGSEQSIGIAQETIASNVVGKVLVQGYAALVNVSASATRGYYLETHTVAKQATSAAARTAGAFGQVLKAGTTPSAFIWGVADQTAAGASAPGNLWTMNKSASQTLTSNTLTQITFDTAVIDGGGSVIDLANERFVAPATGFYIVICNWLWEATVPGTTPYISVQVGATDAVSLIRPSGAPTASMGLNGSGPLSLTSGNFVTMWCFPGGAVTPTARGNASVHLATAFTLVRIT